MSKKRRVLIIVENLPVPFDRRVWQEACSLKNAGYSVYVICPKTKDYNRRYEKIDGIEVFRHWCPEGEGVVGLLLEYVVAFFFQTALTLRIFVTRGFDVIHACNPPDLICFVVAPYRLFFGKKFIFDHHDLCPELYVAKFGRRDFFFKLQILFERLTFALADRSIATNESYKEIAIERGKISSDKVHVVRSGPDLQRFHFLSNRPERRERDYFHVGYLGVMGRQEGLSYLLRAAHHLINVEGYTRIRFSLIGDGPDAERLKEEARSLGLSEYVFFLGRIPDDEMLAVLSDCDVCVNPDEVNEMNTLSTMNKIMEYMALGQPIVQFQMKEGERSAGKSSLYAKANDVVDLAQKIKELLDDPTRAALMGQIGLNRVKSDLAWEHQAPHLLQCYEMCFADGKASKVSKTESIG